MAQHKATWANGSANLVFEATPGAATGKRRNDRDAAECKHDTLLPTLLSGVDSR